MHIDQEQWIRRHRTQEGLVGKVKETRSQSRSILDLYPSHWVNSRALHLHPREGRCGGMYPFQGDRPDRLRHSL